MSLPDLRVVELGDHAGAAYCGKMFADLGAFVHRIEPPAEGPAADDPRALVNAAHRAWLDTGKIRLACDPSQEVDRARLLALVAAADAVIDARPRPQRETGPLSAAALRAAAPQAQIVAVSDFGDTGPYRDFAASDGIVRALAGMTWPAGPLEAPMAVSDHQASVFLGITAFNALMAGVLSGRGQDWAANALEATLVFSEWHLFQTDPFLRSRLGTNRFSSSCPSGAFECRDGWVGGTSNTFPQWQSFCEMMGVDIAAQPDLATSVLRSKRWGELASVFAPRLRHRPLAEVQAEILRRKLPLAAIPPLADIAGGRVGYLDGAMEMVDWGGRRFRAPTIAFLHDGGGTAPSQSAPQPIAGIPAPPARPARRARGTGLPLSHLRILDLSMGWAGPLVTRQLGDLGAQVIKVEACRYFDWWRGNDVRDEFFAGKQYEKNIAFIALNRNKSGVAIDLTTPEGVALVKRIAAVSDAVVENYARDVLPKLGLDYPALRQARPDIVMLSMAAFPQGHFDEARAYGSTLECAVGLPWLNGAEGEPPVMNHFAYGDAMGGITGLAALLAALRHRDRTGEGQHVQLSQVQAMLPLMAPWIIEHGLTGQTPPRMQNRHPDFVPNGVFRTADGWICLTVRDDAMWARLATLTGLTDPALATCAGRRGHEDAIEAALEDWTAGQEAEPLMFRLQAAGVAAGVMRAPDRVLQDPQLAASGFWQRAARPFTGESTYTSLSLRNGPAPFPLRLPAPTLGQANHEILHGLLGLGEAEIRDLETRDIIGTAALRPGKARVRAAATA